MTFCVRFFFELKLFKDFKILNYQLKYKCNVTLLILFQTVHVLKFIFCIYFTYTSYYKSLMSF